MKDYLVFLTASLVISVDFSESREEAIDRARRDITKRHLWSRKGKVIVTHVAERADGGLLFTEEDPRPPVSKGPHK